MFLNILPLNETTTELYGSHKTFHEGDAGLDLFVQEDQTIPAKAIGAFIPLGIKTAAYTDETMSQGSAWLLFPRSSISKTPLRLCNSIGLIDAGYRGEVLAAVDNMSDEDFVIHKGDRLVQAVSFTGLGISFKLVNELSETSRGEGGFGSTEVKSPASKKVRLSEHSDVAKDDTSNENIDINV